MNKEFNENIISDPRIFMQNRLDAHSDHVTYASYGELVSGDSSLRMSLDGVWKFHYSKNLNEAIFIRLIHLMMPGTT